MIIRHVKIILAIFVVLPFFYTVNAFADEQINKGKVTGMDIPRFVSLGSDFVYGRSGPGKQYPVKWEYKRKNLPVEIIYEYDNWRKIRDPDGTEIWIHKTLLSGKRYGIIIPASGYENVHMYKKSSLKNNDISAKLEKGLIVRIEKCNSNACKIHVSGYKGWINRDSIWGIYPYEVID